MKAILGFGPKDVRLVDFPTPVPREGQVLLAVRSCGICGSDKELWHVKEPMDRVLGHEVAGEVVEMGKGVRKLRVGDRVAVNNVGGCGRCPACKAGEYVRCPTWDGSLDVNGGFGEFVAAWERNCMKLDESIDWETACLIFDNFGTPLGALNRAEVTHDDDVVVMGCGPIGLAAIILGTVRGARMIAVDPLQNRRDLAIRLGAIAAFTPGEQVPGGVRELTKGLGARVVIECSSQTLSYSTGLAALLVGGDLVSVGEGAHYDLRPSEAVIRRSLGILGSWYSGMADGKKLMDLIVEKKIDPRMLITHRGPLAEFPQLFRTVCEEPGKVIKAVVVNAK